MHDTQSQTESLLDVVKGIDAKIIMLPEFQRDFRWELDQTYDLFDSLNRDIFIGTLIYGKPSFGMTLREIDRRPRRGKGSNAPLDTHDYSTEQITKLGQTQNFRLVLDGQQRITSIYRAITGLDTVYILLKEDLDKASLGELTLEQMVAEVSGEQSRSSISVKLSDAYQAEVNNLEDEDLTEIFAKSHFAQSQLKDVDIDTRRQAERLYRRATRKLIDLYKQQKLIAYYLLDMSLDKFCVFFERSNSRGIKLDFVDILAAKLYHGFNLRKKIEEFESESHFKLNREIIVRSISYIVATQRGGQVKIDRKYILENLEAKDFDKYWDDVCRLYTDSLQYFANQHYVLSQDWMPSENMIIPVMMLLRQIGSFDQMNEEQRQFLEWWYWTSLMANRYSSASNETIIFDSGILSQVAQGERITARGFFNRMRPLVTEPGDLFSYTKKSSAIYRGILNLLGYASQGLKDWNSTQTIDVTMRLEDHHIYPRAYITGGPDLADIEREEAEQLVDCVVNRTLIPKLLNIQVGKKAPTEYLSELQKNQNSKLAECLPSHLLPADMITDETWNSLFKLFLDERAQAIYTLIENYTSGRTVEMIARHGSQAEEQEVLEVTGKPRLKDMISSGRVRVGERVYTRKQPTCFATIIDGETVEYEGERILINTWGQKMTGWPSISIYQSVLLERNGQPLEKLRY
ncbi:MAG: DUF262 domain-containing protein [Abitibacteriaceae bacterium]|nr:DUF262 domain-containing protein [Abditibacteriaceae bacterium]